MSTMTLIYLALTCGVLAGLFHLAYTTTHKARLRRKLGQQEQALIREIRFNEAIAQSFRHGDDEQRRIAADHQQRADNLRQTAAAQGIKLEDQP